MMTGSSCGGSCASLAPWYSQTIPETVANLAAASRVAMCLSSLVREVPPGRKLRADGQGRRSEQRREWSGARAAQHAERHTSPMCRAPANDRSGRSAAIALSLWRWAPIAPGIALRRRDGAHHRHGARATSRATRQAALEPERRGSTHRGTQNMPPADERAPSHHAAAAEPTCVPPSAAYGGAEATCSCPGAWSGRSSRGEARGWRPSATGAMPPSTSSILVQCAVPAARPALAWSPTGRRRRVRGARALDGGRGPLRHTRSLGHRAVWCSGSPSRAAIAAPRSDSNGPDVVYSSPLGRQEMES